jgi:hypothetical protein
MLDVVLFWAMKKHAPDLSTLDEEPAAGAFIIRIYHDLKKTVVEVNIWGAFSSICPTRS